MTVLPDSLRDRPTGRVPVWALVLLLLVGLLASLAAALGVGNATLAALYVLLTDGVLAALVLACAGGWGHLLCRPFLPKDTPLPLRLATSAGVGLWLLGTVMLVVGTAVRGSLTGRVWWPVVLLGVLAALWQGRKTFFAATAGHSRDGRLGLESLIWVVAALAAGLALAGAVLPAGWLGGTTADSFDILEYHLQVPREYLDNGLIATLPHNVYSFYPLGMEMLFLLGMTLRGSADGGMYLAQMMPAVFGVVAVAAVYGMACWKDDNKDAAAPAGKIAAKNKDISPQCGGLPRRITALAGAVLLASSPWLVYFAGLALVEIAQIAYLALALAWLTAWMRRRNTASAVLLGTMLGSSCCIKYLSVGFIVGPLLAVMLIAALRRGRGKVFRSLGQFALAGAVTLAVFSPWLIRNTLATGNPVFPLATDLFGRGHWTAQQALRWQNGHAPGQHPPVPMPEGWQFPTQDQSRLSRMLDFWLGGSVMAWLRTTLPRFLPAATARDIAGSGAIAGPVLSPAILLLFLGGIAAMVRRPGASRASPSGANPTRGEEEKASPRGAGGFNGLRRDGRPWAPLAVIVLQMAVWAMFTHEMPNRFAAVAIVPVVLLAGMGLGRLSQWRPGRFGPIAAVALLLVAAGVNLLVPQGYLESDLSLAVSRWGWQGQLPAGADPAELRVAAEPSTSHGAGRFMLLGTSAAYYFPRGTLYATVFDTHPLQTVLANWRTGESVAGRLRASGVSDVQVDWAEIRRLRNTYGWPAELSPWLIEGLLADWPVQERARAGAAGPQATTLPIDQLIFTHYRVPGAPANASPLTQPATRPATRPTPRPTSRGTSRTRPATSSAATRPAATGGESLENDLSNPPSPAYN